MRNIYEFKKRTNSRNITIFTRAAHSYFFRQGVIVQRKASAAPFGPLIHFAWGITLYLKIFKVKNKFYNSNVGHDYNNTNCYKFI